MVPLHFFECIKILSIFLFLDESSNVEEIELNYGKNYYVKAAKMTQAFP